MRRSMLPLLLALTVVAFAACGGGDSSGPPPQSTMEPASTSAAGPTAPADDGTAVIALNANGSEEFPVAVFWAGREADEPVLPSGFWFVIVSDGSGAVRRTTDAVAADGQAPTSLDEAVESIPGDPGEAHAAFEALADYILTSHGAYLASLDVLSGGFDEALFDPSAAVDGDSAENLMLLTGRRDAIAADAGLALEILGRQRLAGRNLAPATGLFDWVRDQIDDPIKAQDRAKQARQDLELAFGRMTLAEQREAFRQLKEGRGLDIEAADSAEFIEGLADGEYDNLAAQARNFLQNHEDYFQHFDLRNIETARDEGAKLVSEGAQFYAQALKEVLVKKFPGLEKGWDAISELEEKLQRLQNPEIKAEDVQAFLKELGYDLSLDEAASIIDVVRYSYELLLAKAKQPERTPTPRADIEGGWAVYDTTPIEQARGGLIGPFVAEVDKVNSMKICNLVGGGLCEGTNATVTVEQAGGVVLLFGPFATFEEAARAFCDNIKPGSVYYSQFWGQMATLKHDGQLHTIDNDPGC